MCLWLECAADRIGPLSAWLFSAVALAAVVLAFRAEGMYPFIMTGAGAERWGLGWISGC